MNQKTMTTDSLSEKVENFKKYLNGWDSRISTLDDQHARDISTEKFKFCIGVIGEILNESDTKAMSKFQSDEEKIKAMIANQKKKFHKDLTKVRDILTVEMCRIDNLYELKNRKSHENIRLRSELSKNQR